MLVGPVDWQVELDERWVVIGPNGAGKTSLLRIAAAMDFPSGGTATVLGERLGKVDMAELRQRVGLSSSALAQRVPDDEPVRDFLKRTLLPQLADLGNHSPWLGLLRLVMTEGREAPEIARLHRERVLDPLAAQIQKWAQIAAARGEINGDALQRIPLLLLSPAILATLWNGLYPEDPMNAAAAFEGFLDMVFGVPADPD